MVSSKCKINTYLSIVVVVMGMGAIKVLASERNAEYMDACKSEVNQRFGQEMEISLVNKRRIQAGLEVKLAARLDRDNVEFLNCWVPNNDAAGGGFNQRANAVAVTVKPVPIIH